jgi:exopolysaccharide production protein ExoQ
MIARNLHRRLSGFFCALRSSPLLCIGILIGIIMPVVSGLVFPTYHHNLATPWLEWTKLLEAPFLVCEFLVVCFAVYKGMEIGRFFESLPSDLKIASGLFLVGLWFSSFAVSAAPTTSLALSVGTVLHILFAFSVFFILQKDNNRDFNGLWLSIGAGLIVLSLYTAWRFLLPISPSLVPGGKIEWEFAVPGFINVRYLGTWTGAIAMAFVAMVIQREDKARLSWPEFYFFVSMSMTIWSGTRAAILGLLVATLTMIILQRRVPSLAVVGRLSILTGLAACVAFLLIPYGESSFYLISLGDSFGTADKLSSGRLEMWSQTYDKWLEAPWFGWGSGSMFWELHLGWTHTQPHNAFLQFLLSWGLVGATGACWLLGRAIFAAQRVTNSKPHLWPFMAMLFALLTMSMVDGALYYPRFIMLIMLCLAVILSENGHNAMLHKTDTPMRDDHALGLA